MVGGKTLGSANGVQLIMVKVGIMTNGADDFEPLLKGLEWVAKQKLADPGQPMVAVLSAAFFFEPSAMDPDEAAALLHMVEDAVLSLTKAGVLLVTGAGNFGLNAAIQWPASMASSVDGVLTVGASLQNDTAADWSGFGESVEIYGALSSVRVVFPREDFLYFASLLLLIQLPDAT
jgi:subtilisin family serine protease